MPHKLAPFLALVVSLSLLHSNFAQTTAQPADDARHLEYLWYEAENMTGVSLDARNEPRVNPSWQTLTRAQAPGWAMSGPGVSAEWSQGGESEWNSVAAAADETRATLTQEIEIPRDGDYVLWARYADWAGKTENFVVRVTQAGKEVLWHEFGVRDVIDPHDETSMYWGWAFAWDGTDAMRMKKGPARISVDIEKAAGARRQLDCVLLTNKNGFGQEGRRKPPFAAQRVLAEWAATRTPSLLGAPTRTLAPLMEKESADAQAPALWKRQPLAGHDFLMPWNISEKFWELYDATTTDRPLYPFNAEPEAAFVEKYKGARDVPLFSSPLVVPVFHINHLAKHLHEGSAFLRFIRETRLPFAVNINYGSSSFVDAEGDAALKLLNGELRGQFIGWISGESIGHVYPAVAAALTLTPEMTRRQMLEAYHAAYTRALEQKWQGTFKANAGAMWDELIPAQSTSSTSFAHALASWGVRTLGMETAAVMPVTAMRIAFTRGAARQYGANFLYYHAPRTSQGPTTSSTRATARRWGLRSLGTGRTTTSTTCRARRPSTSNRVTTSSSSPAPANTPSSSTRSGASRTSSSASRRSTRSAACLTRPSRSS
jgi:hypothetical protein